MEVSWTRPQKGLGSSYTRYVLTFSSTPGVKCRHMARAHAPSGVGSKKQTRRGEGEETTSRPSQARYLFLTPGPFGDDVSATPPGRPSSITLAITRRAESVPARPRGSMRDGTLVRQISPVFLARAQVPLRWMALIGATLVEGSLTRG